jgi:hypothetical protein
MSQEQRTPDHDRKTQLTHFGPIIERYVEQYSDQKRHYPGMGQSWASARSVVRAYVTKYLRAHGTLPTGPHRMHHHNEAHTFPADWSAYE